MPVPEKNVYRALEGIGHTTGTLSAAEIRFYRGLKGVSLIVEFSARLLQFDSRHTGSWPLG